MGYDNKVILISLEDLLYKTFHSFCNFLNMAVLVDLDRYLGAVK